MKKLIYTLGFVAFAGLVSTAQTAEPASKKQTSASEQKDGTVKPLKGSVHSKEVAPAATTAPASEVKSEQAPAGEQPKKRMAITEKGVPASKNKEAKPAESKSNETKKENH